MSTAWSDPKRHVSWSILSYTRNRLKIKLETCVASAFMMVHRYFMANPSSPYSLFIVLVASLFSSCKMNECPHTMQQIYSELLRSCRDTSSRIGQQRLIDALGISSFEDREIPSIEISQINQCELDLLESNNFIMDIDTPFKHIEDNVYPFLTSFPQEQQQQIKAKLVKNICILLCFQDTAQLPSSVLAVIVTEVTFHNSYPIPQEIAEWMTDVENKKGSETLNKARELQAKHISYFSRPKQPKQ